MAEAKNITKLSQSEAEDLSAQVAALRSDLAAISESVRTIGAARGEAVRDSVVETAGELRQRGEQSLRAVQARAESAGHQAAETVREQPGMAIGLAVGLGFLAGFLSGRK